MLYFIRLCYIKLYLKAKYTHVHSKKNKWTDVAPETLLHDRKVHMSLTDTENVIFYSIMLY